MFELLCFAALLLAVAVLIATATGGRPELRRLGRMRIATTIGAGLLVSAGAVGRLSAVALGAACIAFLLALHATWLARHAPPGLQSYLDHLTAGGDAAWHEEFERPLREYVRRHHDAAPPPGAGQG